MQPTPPQFTTSQRLGRLATTAAVLIAVAVLFAPKLLGLFGSSRVHGLDDPAIPPEPPLERDTVPVANVVRSEWVQLPGCGCPEVTGGPELAYRMLSAPDVVPIELAYAWLSSDGFPTNLAATPSTALPTILAVRDLELGVSCSPNQVIYASDRAVTLFDRRTGGVVANGPSDGRTTEAPRIEGPLSVRCARATAGGGRLRWTDGDGLPHEVPLPRPPRG